MLENGVVRDAGFGSLPCRVGRGGVVVLVLLGGVGVGVGMGNSPAKR